MSPLFQHWFSMTFPGPKITHSKYYNLAALNRQHLWTVYDYYNRKSAACWKLLPVDRGCRRFNTQWITAFTLRLIICANAYKNFMTLPSTFYDLLFFMTFQARKIVLLNSTTFRDRGTLWELEHHHISVISLVSHMCEAQKKPNTFGL